MGGSDDALLGYQYYLGMHMIICHGPVDSINEIKIDKKSAWSSGTTGGTITINKPSLFGGPDHEGGVKGDVDIEMGEDDQAANDYLVARLGTDIPHFRKVVGAVLNRVYVGMSPYLKKWAFMATRIDTLSDGTTQWYPATAQIGDDMNPIHIIRECLTDNTWGMGYDTTDIDSTSFEAAALTLYNEDFGLSILWEKGVRLNKFIDEIKKHINASMYLDRATGTFKIKLIRDDYSVGGLDTISEDEIIKVNSFVRPLPADLPSEVTVVYNERETNNNLTVTARNIAMANIQGSATGVKLEFQGINDGDIAAKVAVRELKGRSTPLIKAKLTVNHEAYDLNIGDPFIFSYSPYGITSLVMRVTEIEYGTLLDNSIKIDCIQDVFGTSDIVYTTPASSGWSDIIEDAVKCNNVLLIEAPYWDIAQRLGDSNAENLDSTYGFLAVTAEQPAGSVINAYLYVDRGDGYENPSGIAAVNMCPSATIVSAMVRETETTFTYENDEDMDQVKVGTYLYCDGEIMIITDHDDSSKELTVDRGASDTVPDTHAADSRLYCCQKYFRTDEYEYVDSESINVKLLTRTSTDILAIGDADADSLTFDSRQVRPYPPGQFKINTEYYPDYVDEGTITITWVDRNRLTQTAELIGMKESGVTKETGTTYTCELRDSAGTSVLKSESGLTGTSTSFSSTAAAGNTSVQIWLKSVRDGFDSWQTHKHTVKYNILETESEENMEFENGDVFNTEY